MLLGRQGGYPPYSLDLSEQAEQAGGNITDFLLARIAEDEAEARQEDADYANTTLLPTYDSQHQANWNTERVLAECKAKREIIRWWVDGLIGYVRVDDELTNPLLPLAAIYKDHPDYQEERAL